MLYYVRVKHCPKTPGIVSNGVNWGDPLLPGDEASVPEPFFVIFRLLPSRYRLVWPLKFQRTAWKSSMADLATGNVREFFASKGGLFTFTLGLMSRILFPV